VNRLPFLDWTRGLAVLIMIECHAFNSFVRLELRHHGAYLLSQFVGGMAAVLFLFLAGVTFGFQMDRLDRKNLSGKERFKKMLRRAGYILAIAFLFRISNAIFTFPLPPLKVWLKVDILNCMGVAMGVMALATLCPASGRARVAALAGLAIAFSSPLVSSADWSGVPGLVRDYVVPDRGRFAFFPWAAYLAFGVSAGSTLCRMDRSRLEHSLQWALIGGFAVILGGQYCANLPYTFYTKSEFWLNSPALVVIRLGIILVILAGAYLWTEFVARPVWSWVQSLGKTSLMVYWVHVVMVYGWAPPSWKKGLSIPQAAAITVAVIGLMVILSVVRLRWKGRKAWVKPVPVPEEAMAGRI
jgi:uncharacterized membrane protein